MTTLILRRIKDHLVLTGPDIEPMQFKTRPHHAIEIEQPARSDMGRKNVARAVTICEFGEIVMSLARCACSYRVPLIRTGAPIGAIRWT